MAVKVKVNLDFRKLLRDIPRGIKRSRAVKDLLEDEITATIESGVSPVKGLGEFKPYSRSYRDTINKKVQFREINDIVRPFKYNSQFDDIPAGKSTEPVNLRLNGDLLKSLKVTSMRGDGLYKIRFEDEKADWHNAGRGKLPVRQLLPTKRGQTFRNDILNNFVRRIQRIVNIVVSKSNK